MNKMIETAGHSSQLLPADKQHSDTAFKRGGFKINLGLDKKLEAGWM